MDGPEGSTLNMMYLEIPVTILFKVPVKRLGTLVTGAGPYASLGLTGKEVYDSQHTVSNIFKSKLGSNGYNRTDFGFNFQAGTQLNSNITLAIRHGLGINNIAPEPYTVGPGNENRTKGVIKNQVSSFSIGYLF